MHNSKKLEIASKIIERIRDIKILSGTTIKHIGTRLNGEEGNVKRKPILSLQDIPPPSRSCGSIYRPHK